MGAGQSTSTSSSSPEFTSGKSKTSYYTLLGVPRSVTEEEIKKAYRRKALELHPDRNYGNVESATQLFAEVQSAYEILSDPQERAWYDSHEAAILRGDDDISGDAAGSAGSEVYAGEMKVTTADDLARLLRKFNSGVEFSDAPSGFFGFLRETFERLAKEEQVAVRWEGGDEVDYPGFGHKEDSYDNVVKPFYAVWSSFATRKSFKWLDKYRLSDAPDRRYRRAMEKENEKAREDGRREFNDAVRSLVAFVRKRDPRYVPTQQSEEERQRVLRDAADAQKARARKEKEEVLKQAVPEWAQVVQKDVLEGEIEESGSEDEQFECVACRKTFKSEKQWEAHEKSKKHQKAVQSLKKKMRKENQQLDIDDDELDEGMDALTGVPGVNQSDLESLGSVKDDDLTQHTDALKLDSDDLHEEESEKPKEEEEDLTPADLIPAEASDESSGDNSDYAPEAVIKDRIENELHGARRITSGGRDSHTFQSKEGIESGTEDGEGADVGITRQPKKGKAAQKRAKKAAAAATAEQTNNKFKCAMCQAAFPSKTRLFQHIKDFGHAALKPTAAGGVKKKGKR